MNWSGSGYQKANGEGRDNAQRLAAGRKGTAVWTMESADHQTQTGNAPILRRQGGSPQSRGSWAVHHDRGFLNHLRSYAALFARMDVVRMLCIHQVSNKWRQAQDFFHAFVRSMQAQCRRSGANEVLPAAGGHGSQDNMKRWDRRNCCFSTRLEKHTLELDMRGCIANGKTEIGCFRLEKRRCQRLRLRPTRSVNRILLSVILTHFQGENRSISCFHLLFHLLFHLSATAKYPQSSQLPLIGAAIGDGRWDGKWAVATPLFDGNCRPGTLRVPLAFTSLQGRHRPFPLSSAATQM